MLNDIKPLFNGGRVTGCIPCKIVHGKIIITKWEITYSILMGLITIFIFTFAIKSYFHDSSDWKRQLLSASCKAFYLSCLIADGTLTMFWNEQITSALDRLGVYDIAAKLKNKTHHPALHYCRCVLTVVFIYWIIVGYLSYESTSTDSFFAGICYGFYGLVMSLQIVRFCGIMWLIYRRFIHLNQLVMPKEIIGCRIKLMSHEWRSFKLSEIWSMHCSLVTAAEEMNCIYSVQLLLWIITMFLNGMSKVYSIIVDHRDRSFIRHHMIYNIRETMVALACFIHLFLITISCHVTSRKANSVAGAVFSACSLLRRKLRIFEDSLDAAIYFCLKKLHFTAASGFIRIDLQLVLSIAGVMATYLVILKQKPGTLAN